MLAASIVAWTAFPAAVFLYFADLAGSVAPDYRLFDEAEVWLLAAGAVALKIAAMRADDALVEDAWHDGLRLGVARAGHCVGSRRTRFFAREGVWQVFGYIACCAWTAAAIVTYLAVSRHMDPGESELTLGMMLLLAPAVQATDVRLIGPGLTRVRVAYDTACRAQQSLQAHAEVYECLQELDALEVIDMVRCQHILEVLQALNALLEHRKSAGNGKPCLTLVENGA